LIRDRKGEHRGVLQDVRKAGYVRVRVNGVVYDVEEEIDLERYKSHTIEAVVDRLVIRQAGGMQERDEDVSRLTDSVETALRLGGGVMIASDVSAEPAQDHIFSEHFACVRCGISLPEIEPRTFSFNTPYGACPTCTGLGTMLELDADLIIPDRNLSLTQGAVRPWNRDGNGGGDGYYRQLLRAVAQTYGIPMDVPVKELSRRQLDVVLHGSRRGDTIRINYQNHRGQERIYDTTYEGVIPNLQRRYRETQSDYVRQEIERYMTVHPCPTCQGRRLQPAALAVTVQGLSIDRVTAMSAVQALRWIEEMEQASTDGAGRPGGMSAREMVIARPIFKELRARLHFLANVGLDYLTLDRRAATLSGGEAQRIRLATQIGSRLMGVLYILDEPSIGLHQRDNARLIRTLQEMRDLGNTVVVVEHDEETIRSADWIIDLGPGAGEHGGRVVCQGTLDELLACPESLTAQFLTGQRRIAVPAKRRLGNGESIVVRGATENNLKRVDVRFPLGRLVCVTGVSGSGKSSLVMEVLYNRLAQEFYRAKAPVGKHEAIEGMECIDKVVDIDQSPIGRTPRSNPATYTNVFTQIRELFASLPEAKMRGYKSGRFSFNVKGGRCEACAGEGIIRIEMQFLPDVYVPCEVCHGKRYNREALEIRYRGRSIADVLDMTVEEAMEFFTNLPTIRNKLETLFDVGLGYIRLGQPATTLSGGEAQRVK
ncbi:MAG: excinuclease ABC subunit UvrA, partial [Chloroflexi bacterium]|nr:excinuclease ABC subunit UvrA [Chloroflexota bacterium]